MRDIVSSMDLPVEIQIRTKSMDNFAKFGLAAHWLYKKEQNSLFVTDKEKLFIRESISVFDNNNVKNDDVYCLDEKGDVIVLDAENTILDFAYQMGSEVGNMIIGASVNGRRRPIDYMIRNGDIGELIRGTRFMVHSDWLKFVYKQSSRDNIAVFLSISKFLPG